jgi:hypothetical protein
MTGPLWLASMMSSEAELELWCQIIPILEPAAMGQALLAARPAAGKNPQVMSEDVMDEIGLSNPEEGWGRTQSPSLSCDPPKTTVLRYVCA